MKADNVSLVQMFILMKFELGTEISNLFHLISLSPLQILSSSTHASVQNISFLFFSLLLAVLTLYRRNSNKSVALPLQCILLFEVLLLSEILLVYLYHWLLPEHGSPFQWLTLNMELGAVAIQLPGFSVFFALMNYFALLLLALILRIFITREDKD
ncbi:MAG: hypothetical protein GYA55_03620 [SAR324 cluster bacterium]|uniref:Uncharacterized protein n=1 Tax=SAR324 cluster bacterium TaxID=2024889 RepID=A0A7X9IKR6_9DELT|nr:hypothetical protein [SAR324 cluster bacterium]